MGLHRNRLDHSLEEEAIGEEVGRGGWEID